jgi:RNA polymerase sigma factor for flagellar operon FliA
MKTTATVSNVKKLWKDYRRTKSEESKKALVEHYFSFVQMIAVKLAERINWQVQPDELASFGVDGLYRSIEAYDAKRGVTFESYANQRIKGSMIDGLRRTDSVPRAVRIAAEQFDRHKQALESHLGHAVSDVDFVVRIGMNEADFHKNRRKFQAVPVGSIDAHVIDDEVEGVKQDFNINLSDHGEGSPDTSIRKQEFLKKLVGKDFTPTEKRILYLYYYKDMTMDKIAKVIDLSESRISQMHKRIIERLRKKVRQNPEYFDESIFGFISK